jgi:Methyltransferase FkbM domain
VKNQIKKLPVIKQYLDKRNRTREKAHLSEVLKHLDAGTLLSLITQEERNHWEDRIKIALESGDNSKIEMVPDAGKINADLKLVMHNGLIIDPLSYYGIPMLELLSQNNGVHEPQEEYVFQEVLKTISDNSVMLELGAFWSFYSMWFNKNIKGANNFMIEPEGIHFGIKNFELNKMDGTFHKAYISDNSNEVIDGVPTICVDDFVSNKKIDFIDILHSDIQGFEFKMLEGAKNLIDNKKVGYLFISTHSNDLHYQCKDHLSAKGFELICSIDMDESYSFDGLLVFRNSDYPGIAPLEVSKRKV